MDFSHNSIMKIDDNTLAGLKVSNMDLGHNNLKKVPTLALQKMSHISKLSMDHNLFYSLEEKSIYQIKGRPSYSKHLINNSVYLLSPILSMEFPIPA